MRSVVILGAIVVAAPAHADPVAVAITSDSAACTAADLRAHLSTAAQAVGLELVDGGVRASISVRDTTADVTIGVSTRTLTAATCHELADAIARAPERDRRVGRRAAHAGL